MKRSENFLCGYTCGCPELRADNVSPWRIANLALTQIRTAGMGGIIGLDFPAFFGLLDELGIVDQLERQELFSDTLEVFEVFRGYQDEYRARNSERAQAEETRRKWARGAGR